VAGTIRSRLNKTVTRGLVKGGSKTCRERTFRKQGARKSRREGGTTMKETEGGKNFARIWTIRNISADEELKKNKREKTLKGQIDDGR